MSELPESYEAPTEAAAPASQESKVEDVASLLMGGEDITDPTPTPASRRETSDDTLEGVTNPSDDLLLAAASEVASEKNMKKTPDDPTDQETVAAEQAPPPPPAPVEYQQLEAQANELNNAVLEIQQLAQAGQISQEQFNYAINNAQQMFAGIQQDARVVGLQQAQLNIDRQNQQIQQTQQALRERDAFVERFPELRTEKAQLDAMAEAQLFLRSKGMSDAAIAQITDPTQQRLIYEQ
ncbi:MAG: hypothetical protein JRD04_11950, partial [Deltaproteobacteria bacterium]|nr:hypothetical protein [Deltaproteobacteria bacterium]